MDIQTFEFFNDCVKVLRNTSKIQNKYKDRYIKIFLEVTLHEKSFTLVGKENDLCKQRIIDIHRKCLCALRKYYVSNKFI
jgi:hypothetical protein